MTVTESESREWSQLQPRSHADTPRLRLVLVGPLPPPSAGMANQTEQLARLLLRHGLEVRVVATNARYRPAWAGRFRGFRAGVRLFTYLIELRRALQHADLAHVMANSGWAWFLHAVPAVWAARAAGVPVLINYRGGNAQSFFARWFAWVRPTLSWADAVLVPSGFLEAVFRRHGFDALVVPNVVDLDRFSPTPRPDPGASPHLVIARNLEPIYDISTGLRAFATVRASFPDARLSVAGTGPLRADLDRLTAELGLTDAVHFTGRLENAQMSAFYRSADLMLNPSLVDNMPISILEALASGVPVVSTGVGGIPFLVEHGRTALLVPPGEPAAMAAAATRILRERELADTLRAQGLVAAAQYSWPAVRTRLLEAYQSVLHRRGLDSPRDGAPR